MVNMVNLIYIKRSEIKFNLSHSGDCAVFAISFKDEVGIDLEEMRKDIYSLDMETICLSKENKNAW
jgi:phosphopantetheinyl transferase